MISSVHISTISWSLVLDTACMTDQQYHHRHKTGNDSFRKHHHFALLAFIGERQRANLAIRYRPFVRRESRDARFCYALLFFQ